MNRVLYHEWFPQMLYNHHQSGPAGTVVVVAAAARSRTTTTSIPLLILGLQSLGARDAHATGDRGQARRDDARRAAPYDGWWNGGIRNTGDVPQHHRDADRDDRQPDADARAARAAAADSRRRPARIRSRRRSGISGSRSTTRCRSTAPCSTTRRAIRENLLFNIYRMGQRSIERGSDDTGRRRRARDQRAGRERRPADAAAARRTRTWRCGRRCTQARAARSARATSFRRTRPTSRPRRSSSTRCARVNITVDRATRGFSVAGKTLSRAARTSCSPRRRSVRT